MSYLFPMTKFGGFFGKPCFSCCEVWENSEKILSTSQFSSFYWCGFSLLRNEGKVCNLTTEDSKECVHAIFRDKSKCEHSFGEGKEEMKKIEKKLGQNKRVRQGLRGLESWARVQTGKEEGAVSPCEVLMRSRGRQLLINFYLITYSCQNCVDRNRNNPLEAAPGGWTESQTVHTSALTFMFKGIRSSSLLYRALPSPFLSYVLKALILQSSLCPSVCSST